MTAASLLGRLDASFSNSGGRLQARIEAQSPLELRGPFSRAEQPALYLLRNATAGMFAADRYDLRADVSGAVVQVASTAAGKAFAMQGGHASSTTRLSVRDGGHLTWGPHATILQAGSSLTQETTLQVDAGSTALLAEVLVLGRLASGERNGFASYENALQVLDACGDPLYEERYVLTPGPDLDASLAGRGALASVYFIGSSAVEMATCLRDAAPSWPELAGWSALPNDAGIVARCLADSLSDGMDFVSSCLALLTP